MALVGGLACSTFVLVGVGLKKVRRRVRRPLLVGAVSLGAGAGLVSLPVYRPLEIKSADFGTPGLSVVAAALLCTGLILLAESVVPNIPGIPRQAMVTVAQCATVVFLSHGIMLLVLRTPHAGSWTDFVLVVTVPFLVAILTRGSRWAPWIHGAPPRRRRGT